ncbi:DegQ family serine endoprotease [Robbsia sp. Bb-Pol-6]|uniref:Probable periplasmic serine endoprotease DegP-like n=1 Tax=Robbsia betulipollinis TaxID=2981849 RepID=A0ABT3ZLW4_9BURK|nr:DegQ family serine endoprotease [Robbsia betulipollinis]MCY0387514.1 DegQ family serine endoprotease [Robbsia betulipollinis]
MQQRTFKRTAAASVLALAIGGGYLAGARHYDTHLVEPARAAPLMPAEAAAKTGVPDFSGLAETYSPAVVNISAKHDGKPSARAQSQQQLPVSPDDPFYQFFKHFYGDVPHQQQDDAPSTSLGSGFVVSPDGYILTNAHVVEGANVVTVKLTDKREFRAKVVGVDKPTDVAVLKIDAKNLPIVKIGDPSRSKVGQWVVAIGSPYGFINTVTSGIISAKSRSLPDDTYVPFIQTDVPVNPGNSGGPLFNLDGEVIGINSMIYSQTGGFQGLSFAIPINVAMKVKNALISDGHVSRGRIGVTIQELNQSLANSFGLKDTNGALVASVDASGPAAKAGIKPGDVILAVNGQAVDDSSSVPAAIADIHPGAKATLQVWRDGARRSIDVTVGRLGDEKVAAAQDDTAAPQGRLGVAARPLTPQERSASGIGSGLLVEQSTGAARNAGIQQGDVILSINGQPVTSADQLRDRIAHAGNSVALLIQREDSQIFVPVDLGS